MSHHHHHPGEGHGPGNPPNRGHLRHNWFFYVAGFFLLLALVSFVLSGNLAWRPALPPSPAPSSNAAAK
jgi:hypothetical protein